MFNERKMGKIKSNFNKILRKIYKYKQFLVFPILIVVASIVITLGLFAEKVTQTAEITTMSSTTIPVSTTERTETIVSAAADATLEETKETLVTTKKKVTTTKKKQTPKKKKSTKKKNTKKKVSKKGFGSFKSYTDYRCLSRSSAQWKLQKKAYTDSNGLRKIGDAYLVAMGSYYGTKLGTKYKVTLSSGKSFTVMLCDSKANRHTDSKNQVCTSNGSVIEFYVEADKMPSIVRKMGSVGALEQFSGSIVSIEKTT